MPAHQHKLIGSDLALLRLSLCALFKLNGITIVDKIELEICATAVSISEVVFALFSVDYYLVVRIVGV